MKIYNTTVYGFAPAIRGMRNPHESWGKSDSYYKDGKFYVGKNDLKLMRQLTHAGKDHRKYMRMIEIWVDIEAPNYITNELDTYKIGTVRNSCSLQHKGASRDYTIDDFSIDDNSCTPKQLWLAIIAQINYLRRKYIETGDYDYFRAMRQLMPQSYNYRFTWHTNYEVLYNIYNARKNHRLKEWHDICAWIEQLPLFKEICID